MRERLRDSLRNHVDEIPHLTPTILRQLNPSLVKWLGLCPIDGHQVHVEPSERVSISFRDLLAFLKCPLQGWARRMLELHEDDHLDEFTREDEPFVSGHMDEAIVLREAFLDAIRHDVSSNDTTAFESVYNAQC